ncbi:hypothetical protein QOT17_012557 [Balamuthia mandrillaris]
MRSDKEEVLLACLTQSLSWSAWLVRSSERAWSMASSLSVGRVVVVGEGVLEAGGIAPPESGPLWVPEEGVVPVCDEVPDIVSPNTAMKALQVSSKKPQVSKIG